MEELARDYLASINALAVQLLSPSFLFSLVLDFRQYKRIERTLGCFFFCLRDIRSEPCKTLFIDNKIDTWQYLWHSRLSQTANLSSVNFIFGFSRSNLSWSRHACGSCWQFRTPFSLGAGIQRSSIGHRFLTLFPQSSRSKI